MALSKYSSTTFPFKVRCPNAEKMQKENRRKYVVLNLNVFGFDIVANWF
jgi:hypothetical protein